MSASAPTTTAAPSSARVTPETARRITTVVGTISLALLGGSLALSFVDRARPTPPDLATWNVSGVLNVIDAIVLVALGMLIGRERPGNVIGSLFLVLGSTFAVSSFAQIYAVHALVASPGSIPGGRLAGFVVNVTWPIAFAIVFLLLLLFPTGRPLTPRWRPVVVGVWVWLGYSVGIAAISAVEFWSTPFDVKDTGGLVSVVVETVWLLGLAAILAMALVSVVLRFRRSRGEERLQLKWFTYAVALVIPSILLGQFLNGGAIVVVTQLALIFVWIAIAIAILRYHLYDVDIVIRKTVMVALLVVFLTVAYVVIATIVSLPFRGSQLSAFLATVVVAVSFAPARDRARRLADRLVYGRRATPYEVLTNFSERVGEAYANEDVLARMAQVLKEGTGADSARVLLRVGDEMREAAAIGDASGEETIVEVAHQGQELGALAVALPASDPMDPAKRELVEGLAAQAGLVLRNVKLIEELKASRQRLVAAQDEERRRIERNIHDGAQQQLVALAVRLKLADSLVDREPEQAHDMLASLRTDATAALEDLRDLARGIYPPLLADQGLPEALEAQARRATVPTTVQAEGIGRFSRETESAIYFSCLEALQNVAKYANATHATVRLTNGSEELRFEVRDDGHGFDPGLTSYGTGLQGIADRLAALGGELVVTSAPGDGTSVVGRLPVAVER